MLCVMCQGPPSTSSSPPETSPSGPPPAPPPPPPPQNPPKDRRRTEEIAEEDEAKPHKRTRRHQVSLDLRRAFVALSFAHASAAFSCLPVWLSALCMHMTCQLTMLCCAVLCSSATANVWPVRGTQHEVAVPSALTGQTDAGAPSAASGSALDSLSLLGQGCTDRSLLGQGLLVTRLPLQQAMLG